MLWIGHQQRQHALERARGFEGALGYAQLQAHQLQQVSGLFVVQVELFPRFAKPSGIDQLSDTAERRRQRRRCCGAERVLYGHTDILAECAAGAHGRAEFVGVPHAGV